MRGGPTPFLTALPGLLAFFYVHGTKTLLRPREMRMTMEAAMTFDESTHNVAGSSRPSIKDLEPLLDAVVSKVMAELRDHDPTLGSHRLAYSEAEAATLLGVKSHVIRDARHLGKITPTKVGGRIAYTRQELVDYLERQKA